MDLDIFAVGDSHSVRCFENHATIGNALTLYGVNKLDGKTAFKLRDHDRRVRKIIAPIADRHIIFVFGEVDVRIHIKLKHEKTGVPVGTLIENTARRYIDYVEELRAEGYDIHVFNVVPTGDFAGERFERWKKNLHYPFTATYAERRDYTLRLNRRLAAHCRDLSIPFIDIYDHLVEKNGVRKRALVYDFAHIDAQTADILLENYRFDPVDRFQTKRASSY